MQLIEEVAEKDPRLGDLCVSYMLSLSPATKKEDVDALLDKAIAFCVGRRDSLLLTACYLHNSQQTPASRDASLALLLKTYLAVLSAARKTPSQSVILAGGEIAANATHDMLTKDLFPALSRAVKRNAEMAIPCILRAATSLKVDPSRYLSFLVDTCMHLFKQESETARLTSLLSTTIQRCSDGEAILNFVLSLLKEMDQGRFTPAVRRVVYVGVHVILANVRERVMGKTAVAALGKSLSAQLLKTVQKETNATAKVACCDCLGAAVSMSGEVSEDVMKWIEANTAATAFKQGVLFVLMQATSTPCQSFNAELLMPKLGEVIAAAIARPFIAGCDGVMALPSLVQLSILAGKEVPAAVSQALQEGSVLLQNSVLFGNKEDEIVARWTHQSILRLAVLAMNGHALKEEEQMRVMQLVFVLMVGTEWRAEA